MFLCGRMKTPATYLRTNDCNVTRPFEMQNSLLLRRQQLQRLQYHKITLEKTLSAQEQTPGARDQCRSSSVPYLLRSLRLRAPLQVLRWLLHELLQRLLVQARLLPPCTFHRSHLYLLDG